MLRFSEQWATMNKTSKAEKQVNEKQAHLFLLSIHHFM